MSEEHEVWRTSMEERVSELGREITELRENLQSHHHPETEQNTSRIDWLSTRQDSLERDLSEARKETTAAVDQAIAEVAEAEQQPPEESGTTLIQKPAEEAEEEIETTPRRVWRAL